MGATTFYLLEKERQERERNAEKRKSEAGRQEGHEIEKQPEAQGPAENVNAEGQAPEAKPLSDFTVPELKEKAKEKEIEAFSTMKKPELIKVLGGE